MFLIFNPAQISFFAKKQRDVGLPQDNSCVRSIHLRNVITLIIITSFKICENYKKLSCIQYYQVEENGIKYSKYFVQIFCLPNISRITKL